MKALKKYDFIWIIITCVTLIIIYYLLSYLSNVETQRKVSFYVRSLLENRIVFYMVVSTPIIIQMIYYIKYSRKELRTKVIISDKFDSFIDNLFGGIWHATLISSGVTVIKGLYILTFFNEETYFLDTNGIDLIALALVSIFLIYLSLVKTINSLKDIILIGNTKKVIPKLESSKLR